MQPLSLFQGGSQGVSDKVDLIENEEYGYCSLIKATKSVLDRLDIENRTFARITSRERVERRLVDPIALREAVINAMVHNDYSREVPPVFEIYSDRIEITSYGGLPAGLSEEDFFGCRSMSRNRELMRVFKDVGLVEQLGSGMSRILRAYDRSVFSISPNFLVVSFRYPEGFTPQVSPQETHQDSLEDKILAYCIQPHSKKEIAAHFGYKDAKSFGERYTEGLLEDVDLESYRAEARETMQIRLDDENGEINPIPVSTDVGIDVPELDTLSNILKEFHDIFGKIDWTDEDKIRKQIADLPEIVSRDETYQNAMRFSDKQNARAESDRATGQAILATMSSGIELYREVQSNESFRRWILDMVFNATYNPPVAARTTKPRCVVYRTEPEKTLMVAEPSFTYGKKDKDDKH